MNSYFFSINGKYLKTRNAKISVLDIGLLRGYGVFDFLVTYDNRPFLIKSHINRLFNSADMIGLNIGKSKKEIENIIFKTLEKNRDGNEKTIRIVVTGGIGENSLKPSNKSTVIVIVQKKHKYPSKFYKNGVKIITYNYVRSMANAKSLDYSVAIQALKQAKSKNAIEALYIDKKNDFITEATTSNIFIVRNKKILTPGNNILKGITRDLVIKLEKAYNPVVIRKINLKKLYSADEIFITASNKEIMPVVKINNKLINNGKVGPVTKSVINDFNNFIKRGKW